MVNPRVDELSMMTYVSQFPDAKLKPGAPIKQKGDASKVKVSGPGVEEEGVAMGIPVLFYINTQEAGNGNLDTHITGSEDEIDIRIEDKKDGTYVCSYVPPYDGPIQIDVRWSNKHVKGSPFKVNVSPATNALACRAYGPGVEGGDLKEDDMVNFTVETSRAGPGDLNIAIKGPKGPLECDVTQKAKDKYDVSYTPLFPGQYTVDVTYSSLHIKDSPFKVRVEPDRPDASKCRAEGPGIEESLINEETWFKIHTNGAGKGELVTNIRSPHGEVPIDAYTEGKVTTYKYKPSESGELVITVKYGGEHIPGSRFRVQVDPLPDASKCIAVGAGLSPRGVRLGEPAHFKVKTKDAGKGEIAVKITSPTCDVPVNSTSSSSNEHDFVYVPSEAGMYQIEIEFSGEQIPGSVFPVAVTDSSKVYIEGPGIDGELLAANVPLKYVVDARGAGPGELACHVQTHAKQEETDTVESDPTVVKVDDDGVFEILYTPKDAGIQKMKVSFDDSSIPKTPIRLNLYDASKVVAEGPGLENGNKTGELTHFTMDLKEAGDGSLHVHISGPSEVPLVLKDQANDVIHAEYTPTIPGDYTIMICLQEENIPGSPFHVNIKPKTDPSAVKAYGAGIDSTDLTTGTLVEFEVDYTKGGEGDIQVSIQGPAGGVEYTKTDVCEGLTKYGYLTDPDEAGYHNIDIQFADVPIPNSPFQVPVKWKPDPTKVLAEGAGLQGGTTKEWTEFNLDLRKAGEGGVNVSIRGPSEVEVKYDDHRDGTMTVKYYPKDPGEHEVDITFNGEHIPGSIFKPIFDPCTDATKCTASGPGLRKDGVKVGDPGEFVIDTSAAGKGAVDVIVNGPIGGTNNGRRGSAGSAKPIITNNQDGTYSVAYNPRKVGVYNLSVVFGDEEIPDSPYRVNITDPTMIAMNGPGCAVTEEKSFCVNQPLEWTADCTQAGPGKLEASITHQKKDDEEPTTEEVAISVREDGVYQFDYNPEYPQMYRLDILYSQNPLNDSPIISVLDPSKVQVSGTALDGININTKANLVIDTSEAGNGNLFLELVGPSPENIESERSDDNLAHQFSFVPSQPGEYCLNVKFGDETLPSGPFIIPVRDITKISVSGSGITGVDARVGIPANIVIDTTNSGPAEVMATVTDPSGNSDTIDLTASPDNNKVFSGCYNPSEPGNYNVMVQFNNEEIEESPFLVSLAQPENVQLEGEGLKHAFVGLDNVIDCYTKEAGQGIVSAEFDSPSGLTPVKFEIIEVNDEHYQVHYEVETAGLYSANILFNNFPVEEEPRTIPAIDLSKCTVSGPGINSGILANVETHFIVDSQEAGKGDLEVSIQDLNGNDVSIEVTELQEGVNEIKYTPIEAGEHTINVLYDGLDVDQSPILLSTGDPEKVVCSGPGLSQAIVNEEAEFNVDLSKAGEGSLNIQVTGPEEVTRLECIQNDNDEPYDVVYVAEKAGLYQFHVKFADKDVPGSPFEVKCHRPPPDASKCRTIDLEKPFQFTVDCKDGGGSGLLEVGVCGSYVPADLISVHHNGDYTFNVSYQISEPGETIISVKWHGQHLTGSPFTISID